MRMLRWIVGVINIAGKIRENRLKWFGLIEKKDNKNITKR